MIARVMVQKPWIVVEKCHAIQWVGKNSAIWKSSLFRGDDTLLDGCNIVTAFGRKLEGCGPCWYSKMSGFGGRTVALSNCAVMASG